MKKLLTIILAFLPILAFSQIKYDSVRVVKPQNFTEALTIDTAIVQIISQKAGVNRRVNFQTVADWILAQQPNLDSAQYANDTLLLFYGPDTILAVIPSGTIDTAYLSGDTLGIVFAGDTTEVVLAGFGGIYGGSGTVPASTWVEQLGSLIFDIDSLGSFTIGDIDEKSTGAKISISNSAGNDGGIIIKSGSGAGYTDATVEVNNYYLPGTTPTGEGLPAGDYMWIVSQAGVRKGQDSTGWIHIDSLLNGYTTGAGTSGTLPIWTGANSLGNSSVTESGQVISSSLTGALKLPAGTDAQDPVWAAGMLRYNTTANGIQGYDGTAERYLPWADADNWATNRIPYSDGAKLTSSDILTFNGTELKIGNAADAGGYNFQVVNGRSFMGARLVLQGSETLASMLSVNNTYSAGTGYAIDATALSAGIAARSTNEVSLWAGQNSAISTYTNAIRITAFASPISSTPTFISLNGGRSILWTYAQQVGSSAYSAARIIPVVEKYQGGYPGGSSCCNSVRLETSIAIENTLTTVSVLDSLGVTFNLYGAGVRTGSHAYSTGFDASGRLIEVPEKWGTISTSTDGSGDIVVAHGMGTTPTSVQVTVTGTTPYVVTVHTIDATNFTVRFYDMTGAAVSSTAVTATWHAKT